MLTLRWTSFLKLSGLVKSFPSRVSLNYYNLPLPPPPTLKNVHPDKRICIKGGDSQLCHLYMGGSIKLGNPGSRFQ